VNLYFIRLAPALHAPHWYTPRCCHIYEYTSHGTLACTPIRYGWLVEVNTGVASQCLGPEKCATTYVGPTGLGAAFNRSMWEAKGTVLSTEMRAFSNANWCAVCCVVLVCAVVCLGWPAVGSLGQH
jgi:hypothetical protein